MKKFRIGLIVMSLFLWGVFLILVHNEKVSRISVPVRIVDVIEEDESEEDEFHVEVMLFTEEEAESLLQKFEEERKEAERKAAIERVSHATYSASYFKRAGRISWGNWSWTWYSERVLPGYGLRIKGRHTDSNGYVRDGDGYLCLASDVLRKGTIIETPFGGYGKIYDCGCGNNYTVDVYVGW